jgi:tetratricopeptide (TPR) repeat protein
MGLTRRLPRSVLALIAVTVAGSAGLGIRTWRIHVEESVVRAELPPLPALELRNDHTVSLFEDADAAARRNPLLHDPIGKLGMLYHAHLFEEQARICYRLARRLAPEEFRWVYYAGVLEQTYHFDEKATPLFNRAVELRPEDVDSWARLGDVRLSLELRNEAQSAFAKALQFDANHPLAAIGRARLAMLERDWPELIAILQPVIERYPRYSAAHQYLARAYDVLSQSELAKHHREIGEYGSAVDGRLMRELYELAVPAILNGSPIYGPILVEVKCVRCHTTERILATDQPMRWWARTVRRMQRQGGITFLTDDEAAGIVAYLSRR